MNKNFKQQILLVTFGILLFAAVMNISSIALFVKNVFSLIFPVAMGFFAAFILNVPMSGFENLFKRMFKKAKKPPKEEILRAISLILTIICLAVVIAAVITLLIPELVSSAKTLYNMAYEEWPKIADMLNRRGIDASAFTEWLDSLSIENIIQKLSGIAGTFITSAIDLATSALSGAVTFLAAVVIAIYALLEKKTLARHSKKILSAFFKESTAENICRIANLARQTNAKFISGQCVEACILGVLIFIAFTVVGIPYASLVGILATVSAFIPYVGAFFACAVGAFLVLITAPSKVLICVAVYLAVQFIENQFIYPKVVGSSVGLSPLWTLAAVLIGGNLFGLFGMIFFIPIAAVAATLLKEYVTAKNAQKEAQKAAVTVDDTEEEQ